MYPHYEVDRAFMTVVALAIVCVWIFGSLPHAIWFIAAAAFLSTLAIWILRRYSHRR
jgi:hypothetical protein